VADPVGDLLARYARTHGPFVAADPARRLGLGVAVVSQTLARLEAAGRVVEGEFRPGGSGREWLDAEVLRRLRRRSLAALRREVEPVPTEAMARFLGAWQGVGPAGPRSADADALFRVVEQLQGPPSPPRPWSARSSRPASPATARACLDELCASGEVVWAGAGALGSDDGWVGLYLAEGRPAAAARPGPGRAVPAGRPGPRRPRRAGAMFFRQLSDTVGEGNDSELLLAVWELVWAGQATNDTLAPLRALVAGGSRPATRRRAPPAATAAAASPRPARAGPPAAAGRWSLVPTTADVGCARRRPDPAGCMRWPSSCWTGTGVLTRGAVVAERIPGGSRGGVPGAEGDGGRWPLPARVLRGRARRGPVRGSRGGGPAPVADRPAVLASDPGAGRRRPGQSLWRRPVLARQDGGRQHW
jgi:ATP-dependent Lhr-like helicase